MLSLDHCYLCLRDQNADQSPSLPDAVTVQREVAGWYTIQRTSDGRRFLAWRANTNAAGTRGLYAIFAPLSILQAIAAVEPICAPARTLWTLAQAGNAPAVAIARRWPMWRWSGSERNSFTGALDSVTNVVRRFIFEGQTLPAPPLPSTGSPWRFALNGSTVGTDAASRYRVTSLIRPALFTTMGEFDLHTTLEDEPET